MQQTQLLKQKVLQLIPEEFDSLALEIFRYQADNNLIYKKYLQLLHIQVDKITEINQIPFLPIEFFKTQTVISGEDKTRITFESSGTTGQNTSQHHVQDPDFYVEIAEKIFERFYGKLSDFQIFALLPSYLERTNSSLVYMVEHFIKKSGNPNSGFYLDDYKALSNTLLSVSSQTTKKTLLIGVTFGLLDFVESGTTDVHVDLSFLQDTDNLIVMETGGMKGRRKELLREEVHEILTKAFHVKSIHSEYGMTELLSQGYSKGEGIFELPISMKILLRDVNDPFHYITNSRSGGINVIDLANVDSCSFIETKDLGSWVESTVNTTKETFRILGRFDNSDIRGCNLMVE
jgi:phenylacetate-coenzyme A ligase PaaK-like adenylate-forming protein